MRRTDQARVPLDRLTERLWQLSSDLMGVIDPVGRLLAVNNAWEAALGWSEEELLAEKTPNLMHPEDAEAASAELARVNTGAQTMKFESRLLSKDGVYRRFSWRCSAAEGCIYIVGRDITERIQREEAARYAQKMEAVGQLTGGIAHDFNNLLTIVRSSVDLLKNPDLPEPRRRRYVDAIDDAVERATKVTQQLLAFARRQKLDPEAFDVGERIADVSELLRQVVGPLVHIETAAPIGACYVEADLCQFETALMNLAINARDAMDGQGILKIEAAVVARMPAIRHHAPVAGEFVAVTVRDTGVGIDPEQLTRIFEPFYTTKETGRGTGLGLSQVYGFVKQSGGGVSVESRPGAGAAFTIYLPRSTQRPEAKLEAAPAEPQGCPDGAAAPAHALVVEDNEEVGQFCVEMMRDLGYQPCWARNALEALEELARGEPQYDLVFSDVVMPGMSGIELAERIRQLRPTLPVLLTSGYSAVLAEEGARGFPLLAKPYSAQELEAALTAILPNGPHRCA